MKTARGSGLARIVTEPAALAGDPDMRPVYVRRKPARGLVALHAGKRRTERIACVRVDEKALRESGARARATLNWFPDDPAMPTLRACCEPREASHLWEALQRGAVNTTGSPHRMIMAQAEPLRYKPQDRCVIRYRLALETVRGRSTELSVIGKVYREREQAGRVHAIAEHLHRSGTRVVARPLGFVEELGIVLAEDVRSLRSFVGTAALRPSGGREPGEEAVEGAATALAALHSCSTSDGYPVRSASGVGAQVLARVDLLAASVPNLAASVRRAGQLVAEALVTTPTADLCLNHGSFKPSQLIFSEPGRVVVTDLDHCCLGDPALDLGYFLAYLRPASLWRGRDVARTWYETAASRFCGAYTAAALARSASQRVASALARARLYEAAVMFKIAARRVHRLNSPRPHELEAIVNEALSRANSASQGAW